MGRVFFNTRKNVVSLTESYQLLAGDSGSVFMLNAAAGLTVTLPAVADAQDGWNCSIYIATNISSNTLTVSATQVLQNGQALIFKGASRAATLTGYVSVVKAGDSDVTLFLNLDNVLTVS